MTDCVRPLELGSPEHMRAFTRRVVRDHVPVSGAFDLTWRCNLRCTHCYVGHAVGRRAEDAGELGTRQVLRLASEAADAGCLYLLLSGGEPFLRPDFPEIYRGVRRLGMLVSVFTNATLLRDDVLAALVEYPPQKVEISVYGASAAVYERVTGVPGSFRRAWRGIDRLLESGVTVGLKTMILRENLHEVAAMEAMATELGLSFRVDPLISPRLDGDPGPLVQRVDPRAAAELELASEKRFADTVAHVARQTATVGAPDLYRCGAGMMTFDLDPQGVLRPCLMCREPAVPAVSVGFGAAWQQVTAAMTDVGLGADADCQGCSLVSLCGYCPGLFALEKGSVYRHPEYACRLGAARSAVIGARGE